MKATAQLTVPRDLELKLAISMTVDEARELLDATKEVRMWPTQSFREILRQALSKATSAYDSEHVITP